MAEAEWMSVGKVVGAQGLKGEVRIYPDSDFPERFLEPGPRWLQRPGQPPAIYQLKRGRLLQGKGLYVVQFEQITSRNDAEALQGAVMLVPADDRPPLEEGEFYVADLVGLTVYRQGEPEPIGTVVDIYSAGNDLLAVELMAAADAPPPQLGKKPKPPTLIPFVPEIVPVVDLAARRIEIDPPEGLLEVS